MLNFEDWGNYASVLFLLLMFIEGVQVQRLED